MTVLARLHAAAYESPSPKDRYLGVVLSPADARELVVLLREACDDCATCEACGAWFCESHGYGEPGCTHGRALCLDCIGSCDDCARDLAEDPDMAYDVVREVRRG